MKRPFMAVVISFITGILWGLNTKSYLFLFAAFLLMLVITLFLYRYIKFKVKLVIVLVLMFAFGGVYAILYKTNLESRLVPYYGETKIVTGYIDSAAKFGEKSVSYVFKIQRIDEKNISVKAVTIFSGLNAKYDFGKRLAIECILEKPDSRRNPGGFDYRAYLLQKGISAVTYADSSRVVELGGSSGNLIKGTGLKIRQRVVNTLKKSLPNQQAALLSGMLIGARDDMTDTMEEAFSKAGLTHIMAVSGANVAFITFPLLFVFKKLRIGRNTGYVITAFAVTGFMFITGFEASVARAVIMALIIIFGKLIKVEPDIYTSIAAAAFFLLVYNPLLINNIGFQLSFSATLSIVAFYGIISKKLHIPGIPKAITNTAAVTIAAQIGVIPITVYHFNVVSIISLITNILVVPITAVVTILGILIAAAGQISLSASTFLGFINSSFLSFILLVAKVSSSLAFSTIRVVTPSAAAIGFYYLSVLFFLRIKPKYNFRLRLYHYTTLAGVIIGILLIKSFIPGHLEITFLDVGNGDSVFIKTPGGNTLLIDGGRGGKKYDNGERVVVPCLMHNGSVNFDMIIASHGHSDHIGGFDYLLDNIDVKFLIMPKSEDSALKKLGKKAQVKGTDVIELEAGDIIYLDNDIEMSVFNPGKNSSVKGNNNSLVIRMVYKDFETLFTGDMENIAEKDIMDVYGIQLSSDILKVPHHGSDTSLKGDILEYINPSIAVISVGSNSYGHPSDDVLKRLYSKGTQVFRTDTDGAVTVLTNGGKIKVKRQAVE